MIFLSVQTKIHSFIKIGAVLCVMFCFSFSVFSQVKEKKVHYDERVITQKKFNTKKIEDYKNNDDFIYTVEKREPSWLENLWNWLKRMFKRALRYIFSDIEPAVGFFRTVLKILPYIIAGLTLFFIIKFFLKVNSRSIANSETTKSQVEISEEESLMNDKNLPQLIEKAILKGNYRLAIRYYYLLALKKLSDDKLINWQQEKTNEDYINELTKNNLSNDFKNITFIYDYVWYGNFLIDDNEFVKSENHFKNFLNNI